MPKTIFIGAGFSEVHIPAVLRMAMLDDVSCSDRNQSRLMQAPEAFTLSRMA